MCIFDIHYYPLTHIKDNSGPAIFLYTNVTMDVKFFGHSKVSTTLGSTVISIECEV